MQIINDAIDKSIKSLGWEEVQYAVEHPKDEAHGDYSTNVALILAKKVGKNPREVADQIVTQLRSNAVMQMMERIEVAGAGFINFYLTRSYLLTELAKAKQDGYGENGRLAGKKVMVEYTDPNPFKEMHIGHLMSNTIGESIARLMTTAGASVKRACYQGDVGLHVAKAVWGMKRKLVESKLTLLELQGWDLKARQQFMGQSYALGATEYEDNEQVKAEIVAINKAIYMGSDQELNHLYQQGRKWSLEYFETIYARLGTKFDEYFFESEAGPVGLMVVEEGLKKGILEVGEGGAVVYKGEADGLHTRVFRNALGLATYEGKELGLAKTKFERYPYDLSYIVTANEITEYFKVLLTVMKKLYPELAAKTTHVPHGVMKLTTGKMSSRTGKVVTGEGLLNELREVVLTKMGERPIVEKELVADYVAVAALKYTVLKQAIGGDIVYDPAKMTNLEGDTGPYIQYTYARARSVISKSASQPSYAKASAGGHVSKSASQQVSEPEELAILRWIYRYPEVVEEAGSKLAPHLVAGYVYELATRFNTFYNKHKIGDNQARLELTEAVAKVLKSGINVLGIVAVEEM